MKTDPIKKRKSVKQENRKSTKQENRKRVLGIMIFIVVAMCLSGCSKKNNETALDSTSGNHINETATDSMNDATAEENSKDGNSKDGTIEESIDEQVTAEDISFQGLKDEEYIIKADTCMQKIIWQAANETSAKIQNTTEVLNENTEEVSTIVGTYKKTLKGFKLDGVATEQGTRDLVQLYWECEGGENPYQLSWFQGTEWLVNVFFEDGTLVSYEVLPCNYNVVKSAMGNAKLMENGADAVQLAFSTYLDDSLKETTDKDTYLKEWEVLTANSGAYTGTNYIYYGYNHSLSSPYAVVIWKHETNYISYIYQYTSRSTKVIGKLASSSDVKPQITYQTLKETVTFDSEKGQNTSLKDIYHEYFQVGCALPDLVIKNWDTYGAFFEQNFNSATMENEMKPDYVLNQKECVNGVKENPAYVAINYPYCEQAMKLFEEKEIQVRYHTLVWHSQTPKWFFYEDYDTTKALVDADTMKLRMKNFIDAVIQYFDKEHPDLLYTIDVVNEAFNGNGTLNVKADDNLWYDTIGYEYVYYAFKYTREAIAESEHLKEVTLVYNDYNMPSKVDIVLNGLDTLFAEHGEQVHDYVDVIGFQGHYDLNTSMAVVAQAVQRFCEEGYEVQITELDIGIPDIVHGGEPTEEQLVLQGEKFKSLMQRLVDLKQKGYPITSVTVWGLTDELSWRQNSNGYDAYALLMNENLTYKPAYFGMALDQSIMSYFEQGIQY